MTVFLPTRTQSMWRYLQEVKESCAVAFIDGQDSEAVFRARLYSIGLRGDAITSEINLAKTVKLEIEKEAFDKKTQGALSKIIYGI